MSLLLLAFFVIVLLPQLTMSTILNDQQATQYAIALAAYSLIYLGAGTLCGRLLRRVSQRVHSYQVLAILAVVNLLLIVAAEVIHFLSRVNTPQLFDVVNPVLTLRTIADGNFGAVDAVACLVVTAVVALAANMSTLVRRPRHCKRPGPPPDRKPAATRWACRLTGVNHGPDPGAPGCRCSSRG